MNELVDAVALRDLKLPSGEVAKGETFTTTKLAADELVAMEMAEPAGEKSKAKRKAEAEPKAATE